MTKESVIPFYRETEIVERANEILEIFRARPELSPKMSIEVAQEQGDFLELAAMYMALYHQEQES